MAEHKVETDKKGAGAVAKVVDDPEMAEDLDALARRRLLGATIWFAILIWLLPKWYAEPVNFHPEKDSSSGGTSATHSADQKPIADKVYRLPSTQAQTQNLEGQKEGAALTYPAKPEANTAAKVNASQKHQLELQSMPRKEHSDQQKKMLSVAGDVLIADDLMVAKGWFVRLAAFKQMANANELLGRLDEAGYEGYVKPIHNGRFYAVVIGPYASKQEALAIKQKVDPRYHVKAWVFHR